MIISSATTNRLTGIGDKQVSADTNAGKTNAAASGSVSSETPADTSVSSLATQLATAAAYSAAKNKGLSAGQLGDKARAMVDQIVGQGYQQWKVRNDLEVPKAGDAESLARAKAATAFVNGSFKDNVGSEPNPFADLSSDQLATIAYDESGTFTINERQAAWHESYRREENFRIQTVAKMGQEYKTTGKLTNYFQDILDNYEQLPLMEQVQYPKNYVTELKEKIKRDFNYRDTVALGGSEQDWITAAKSFLRPVLDSSSMSKQS